MHYKISPSLLKGTFPIPSSKSHTLRAIIFGMLGNGKSIIHNPLPSFDTTAMINACRLLGAQVISMPNQIEIEGLNGKIVGSHDVIDAGNSGQVLRFIGAIAGLGTEHIVLTGDHSIRHNRPIQALLSGLSQLGVFAVSTKKNGFAPIIIQGPLLPGKTTLLGEDSQPVSGLLMAAAFAPGKTEIEVLNSGEKPWIALTLNWFDRLGIRYENHDYQRYTMSGSASYEGFEYSVPGDFSSAAYPLVAALLTDSEVILSNIHMDDIQGDKKLIFALQKMGAQIEYDAETYLLKVKRGPRLQGIKIDVNDFIDAIPILAVIGCFAEGTTELVNGKNARFKESDRIACMTKELRLMGAQIEEREDGLLIKSSSLHGCELQSHYDHRIAMSLAVAAMAAYGDTIIHNIGCVGKSYPEFCCDFQKAGVDMKEIS